MPSLLLDLFQYYRSYDKFCISIYDDRTLGWPWCKTISLFLPVDLQTYMTTAEDFDESNGFIAFNARIDFCMPVTIPPTPECQDDKNWSTLYNEKEINCEWVGRNRLKRCVRVETASTACPVTCGTCPVALPFE